MPRAILWPCSCPMAVGHLEKDFRKSRAFPELLSSACGGMARGEAVQHEGLGSSLRSVTSRFCLLTGQPCSHYCEHRLAGTRALCKSPGFVSLPLNKQYVFPARWCRKDSSSPGTPRQGGRGAWYLCHVPRAHPASKPHWGWVTLSRAKASSKRCWGLQHREGTRQAALRGPHCGVSRHQSSESWAGCIQGYPHSHFLSLSCRVAVRLCWGIPYLPALPQPPSAAPAPQEGGRALCALAGIAPAGPQGSRTHQMLLLSQ